MSLFYFLCCHEVRDTAFSRRIHVILKWCSEKKMSWIDTHRLAIQATRSYPPANLSVMMPPECARREKCRIQLYVSPEGATQVLASLRSTGVAGLVCLCGHTQFIDVAFRSVVVRMHKRRHDEEVCYGSAAEDRRKERSHISELSDQKDDGQRK